MRHGAWVVANNRDLTWLSVVVFLILIYGFTCACKLFIVLSPRGLCFTLRFSVSICLLISKFSLRKNS